jgi:hypothetical protein
MHVNVCWSLFDNVALYREDLKAQQLSKRTFSINNLMMEWLFHQTEISQQHLCGNYSHRTWITLICLSPSQPVHEYTLLSNNPVRLTVLLWPHHTILNLNSLRLLQTIASYRDSKTAQVSDVWQKQNRVALRRLLLACLKTQLASFIAIMRL